MISTRPQSGKKMKEEQGAKYTQIEIEKKNYDEDDEKLRT